MKKALLAVMMGILVVSSCKREKIITLNPPPVKEIYCPECNGTGKVKVSTTERAVFGLLTFGGGFLFETSECEFCNGKGVYNKK